MTITSGLGCAKTVDGNSIHFIFVENSLSHWSLKSPTAAWYVYIYSLIIFVRVFFTLNGRHNQPTRQACHPSVPSTPVSFPTQKIVSNHRPRTKSLAATTSHEHQQWPPPGRAPAQSQQIFASHNFVAFCDFGDVGWMKRWTLQFTYNPFQNLRTTNKNDGFLQ